MMIAAAQARSLRRCLRHRHGVVARGATKGIDAREADIRTGGSVHESPAPGPWGEQTVLAGVMCGAVVLITDHRVDTCI